MQELANERLQGLGVALWRVSRVSELRPCVERIETWGAGEQRVDDPGLGCVVRERAADRLFEDTAITGDDWTECPPRPSKEAV